MGILDKLFGGSQKQTSTSTNEAYGDLKGAFGGVLPYAGQAAGGISQFLGGDSSGFDAYKRGAGFDYASLLGSRGVTGNRAASGLLRSSGTGEALADDYNERTNLYANNYLGQMLGLGNLGLNAGQVLANAAPQTQTTTAKKGGGLGKAIGTALSLIPFSDRRLKTAIERIGEIANGLPWYRFRYLWDAPGTVREGLMSDDVRKARPEAVIVDPSGYDRVIYPLAMEAA